MIMTFGREGGGKGGGGMTGVYLRERYRKGPYISHEYLNPNQGPNFLRIQLLHTAYFVFG